MIELVGKYNKAKVYTDNIDSKAVSQIINMCNQEFTSGMNIAIMSDVHYGASCTIGTTMTIKDKVVPNLVGVDIGCGVRCVKLKNRNIDLDKLEYVITNNINYDENKEVHRFYYKTRVNELIANKFLRESVGKKSIGTLGGGNHFIEVGKNKEGELYLIIHSGSRHIGIEICKFYQKLAVEEVLNYGVSRLRKKLIYAIDKSGMRKETVEYLNEFNKHANLLQENYRETGLELCTGENFKNYLHDMDIVQEYAMINREAIQDILVTELGLEVENVIDTVHNYIDTKNMILRKGAISAQKDEIVIIPMNMRDGSLICRGKGNPEWNYSAPHGAGRILSRSKARELVTMEEFIDSMKGINTYSVLESTLDESPMVYKPMEEIIDNIGDTVEILDIIKPIYNYKSH